MGAQVRRIGKMERSQPLPAVLLRLQQEQHDHDMRNHIDIVCLHRTDRLKHYGLHFAKYVGRLARGSADSKPVERTVVDTLLVALSAANALHQDLSKETFGSTTLAVDSFRAFASAAGQFADACEKIDHLEEFVSIAKRANRDILFWALLAAEERGLDVDAVLGARRAELAGRHFYIRKR